MSIIFGVDSQIFTEGRNGVGSCPMPAANAISATLLPLSFNLGDSGQQQPTVTVSNSSIVCISPGLTRGTVSSFSVVVEYVCTGVVPAECDGTRRLNQFQYDCNSDDTFTNAQIAGDLLITETPVASLATPLVDQCGRCGDPMDFDIPSDPVNHCAG